MPEYAALVASPRILSADLILVFQQPAKDQAEFELFVFSLERRPRFLRRPVPGSFRKAGSGFDALAIGGPCFEFTPDLRGL